jgi:hypothetical protein
MSKNKPKPSPASSCYGRSKADKNKKGIFVMSEMMRCSNCEGLIPIVLEKHVIYDDGKEIIFCSDECLNAWLSNG